MPNLDAGGQRHHSTLHQCWLSEAGPGHNGDCAQPEALFSLGGHSHGVQTKSCCSKTGTEDKAWELGSESKGVGLSKNKL